MVNINKSTTPIMDDTIMMDNTHMMDNLINVKYNEHNHMVLNSAFIDDTPHYLEINVVCSP